MRKKYRNDLKNRESDKEAPRFLSRLCGAEAAKLKKFSAGAPKDASSLGWGAGGTKSGGCPTPSKTDSLGCFGIVLLLLGISISAFGDTEEPVPWFTGPLIAPHGNAVPLGNVELDWYFYLTTFTGDYNGDWTAQKTPNFFQFNPQLLAYIGLTPWMDLNIISQFSVNWTEGQHAIGFNDFLAGLDIQLYTSDSWFPGIKASVREIFPTGKYDHLNPQKLSTDQTGLGSFTTLFALVLYKIYPLWGDHSLSMTVSGEYGISAPTHVHGYNSFGGGAGTKGKVKQGDTFQAICSFEFNLTQNWAVALDNVWTHFNSSHFTGNSGADDVVGYPSGESLSFCPAIEYNFSVNFGIIAGCWFTALGRNSSEFRSAAINFYTFF